MKAIFLVISIALLTILMLLIPSNSLPATATAASPLPTPSDKPPYTSYKGVTIGMPMADARTKLGNPKDMSDEQDYFVFSDRESAQVYYDAAHTVKAVMITFTGKADALPTPKDVLGENAEAKPDGGIYKKVDYPKAGFWLSYSKTAGDEPMVIIAINRL